MMYSRHPLSANFPDMPDDEFKELVADIKAHGLRHSIILYEGKVLDGWHRLRACIISGVAPTFVKYTGSKPAALVISENIHRRHGMTESQRAFAVVECHKWAGEGRPKTPSCDGVSSATTKEMAKESKTSTATVERAKTVAAEGSKELKDAVKGGEVTVSEAAEIAKDVPQEEQAAAVKAKKERAAPKPKPPKVEMVPKSEYDKLVEQYNSLRENHDNLLAELEAVEALRSDETVIKIRNLGINLEAVTRARNDAMQKLVDRTKDCQYWQKQAKKLGWKPNGKSHERPDAA